MIASGVRRAVVLLVAGVGLLSAPAARAQVDEVRGKAILAHPAGKAMVEAGALLAAGKVDEVKKKGAKEALDEWNALSAAEKKEETARVKSRAPEPRGFPAAVEKSGVMFVDGDFARLMVEYDGGTMTVMAFALREGGQWKVSGGPFTVDTSPVVETAPALEGAAILEHEIGKTALEYAKRLATGKMDAAIELLSGPARAKRAAESAAERKESDAYRTKHTPKADALAEQIRAGGRVTFEGEKAYLMISRNITTKNADGSTTFTPESSSLPFELQGGVWKIAD